MVCSVARPTRSASRRGPRPTLRCSRPIGYRRFALRAVPTARAAKILRQAGGGRRGAAHAVAVACGLLSTPHRIQCGALLRFSSGENLGQREQPAPSQLPARRDWGRTIPRLRTRRLVPERRVAARAVQKTSRASGNPDARDGAECPPYQETDARMLPLRQHSLPCVLTCP
jgi:hypothetical protein